MIARLLGLLISMVLYFCVATCVAETILFGYVWSTWQIDRHKVVQILAAAHGIDFAAAHREAEDAKSPPAEQISLDAISQSRAIHVRHLELREQALKSALDQLQFEQQKLVEDRKRYDKQREDFETNLLAVQQQAESDGVTELTAILEKIKAKQAKEQTLRMLNDNRINEVVVLLSGMQDTKRAKIIGEFKTPEDSEKLSEVLRRIREGVPAASLAKETQEQLRPTQPAGP